MGYGASTSLLSDTSIYSTFFRTCPSDKQLATSIARVITYFGWSCINIVSSKDSFFPAVSENVKQGLKNHSVCVAIDEVAGSHNEIPDIILKIKERATVAVNVLLGSRDFVARILDEIRKSNLTKRVWIGSNERRNNLLLVNEYGDVIDGSLWIFTPELDLGDFEVYVTNTSRNISLAYCEWLDDNSRWPDACRRERPSQSNLIGLQGLPLNRITYVINAMFAIARGLEHVRQCDSRYSSGSNCLVGNFTLNHARKLLLRSLKNNAFSNKKNIYVSFNANRELNAEFDILNMRVASNGTLTPVRVGKWIRDQRLVMNQSKIRWPGNESDVPYSGCRDRCPLGTYTEYISACWWSCRRCPHGAYNSNYTATLCAVCPKEQITNKIQSACVDKPLAIINSAEYLTVILMSACGLGEMLTVFVLGVFVRYQVTPVVKAANLTFTVLSLIVLLAWFLIPVLYIGEPTDIICKLRTVAYAVTYTAITSVLLTKTNRLIKIFSAINIKKRPFLSNCWYGFLTCALILVQVGLSLFHVTVFPPKLVYDYSVSDVLVIKCNANLGLEIASLGYNTLLSITCSYLAYRSRNLPGAYNEFKWLCLAMFTNYLSWLTILISHHVSSVRKTNLICIILALILSAYSMLLFLFLPKVCVIFFRPEKNTKQAAIASTRRYSLDQASGIDLSPIQGAGPRRNTSPACLALQFMNGSIGKLSVVKNSLGPGRSQGSVIATIRESSEERKSSV